MKSLLLIPAACLLFAGCKKNLAGGNAEISGNVSHHGRPIGMAKIFVKYAATEFPGTDTSVYDADTRADAMGKYSFKCYKGEYYLYARGTEQGTLVTGGVPVRVRSKEKVAADIPLSEPH